jgi:hypothetical protein
MPKKSAAARSGVQPQRARGQKSFELVLPEGATNESAATRDEQFDDTPTIAAAPKQTKNSSQKVKATSAIATAIPETETEIETKNASAPTTSTNNSTSARTTGAPKSASARLAARRQATLKAQQRAGVSIITPEHFSYVRRDLVTIAVLACVMFVAIFVLYFVII